MKFTFLSLREAATRLKKPVPEMQQMLEAEVSHDQIETALRNHLRANRYAPDGSYQYRYLRAVYDSSFVWEESGDDGVERLYRADYSMDENGAITVGTGVEVRVEVKFTPVAQAMSESAKPMRAITIGSMREAKIGDDGLILVKLIDAGVGSSGYYSTEVLKRACEAGKYPVGLRMFANHQTDEERTKQPEGKVENVVAITREAGHWLDNGPDGPGVYAKAEVKTHWTPFVESMGYDMEVSCDGTCWYSWGEYGGREMPIIEEIVHVKSVDFVTQAGRGGRWMSLQEAARKTDFSAPEPFPANPNSEDDGGENEMNEAQIKEAKEQAQTEGRKQGRSEGVKLYQSAQKVAREALAALALPEIVKESIVDACINDVDALPMKENALDSEALTTRVKDAAEREALRAKEAYGYGGGTVNHQGGEPQPMKEAAKPDKFAEVDAALANFVL